MEPQDPTHVHRNLQAPQELTWFDAQGAEVGEGKGGFHAPGNNLHARQRGHQVSSIM